MRFIPFIKTAIHAVKQVSTSKPWATVSVAEPMLNFPQIDIHPARIYGSDYKKNTTEDFAYLVIPSALVAIAMETPETAKAESMLILPPPPMPYEYALLSELSYSDLKVEDDPSHYSEGRRVLYNKGWQLLKPPINEDNGYVASIWVNHRSKQVVIAHRGSLNLKSWLEDIQSVVACKPKGFVKSALKLLAEPEIIELRTKKGYRLSTTGHSLGGFLAQICVFWSQRDEDSTTYYPQMSAVVFDSPGAADLMKKAMQSNLESRADYIPVGELNIQNFCAMPNIVNTFGGHTGVVWHVAQDEMRFDFVMSHRLASAIIPAFDSESGRLRYYREMTDWPKADYSRLLKLTSVSGLLEDAKMIPLRILDKGYQNLKEVLGLESKPTWFELALGGEEYANYRKMTTTTTRSPELKDLEKILGEEIDAHYRRYPDRVRVDSLDNLLFDRAARDFLMKYLKVKGDILSSPEKIKQFQRSYQLDDNAMKLLDAFSILERGKKWRIKLSSGYEGDAFDYQRQLHELLISHPQLLKIKYTEVSQARDFIHLESWRAKLKDLWKLNREWLNKSKFLQAQARLYLYTDADNDDLKKHEDGEVQINAELQDIENAKSSVINLIERVSDDYIKSELEKLKQELEIQYGQLELVRKFNQAIKFHKLRRYNDSLKITQSLIESLEKKPPKENPVMSLSLYTENPLLASFYNLRGKSFRALGDIEGCIICYKKALTYEPDNATILSSLGYALNDLNKTVEALSCHEKAYELDSSAPVINSNYAHGLYEYALMTTDREEKKRLLQKALTLYNYSLNRVEISTSFYERGLVYLALGQPENYLKDLERCLAAQANHPLGLRKMAEVKLENKEYKEALKFLTDAENSLALRNIGFSRTDWSQDFKNELSKIGDLRAKILASMPSSAVDSSDRLVNKEVSMNYQRATISLKRALDESLIKSGLVKELESREKLENWIKTLQKGVVTLETFLAEQRICDLASILNEEWKSLESLFNNGAKIFESLPDDKKTIFNSIHKELNSVFNKRGEPTKNDLVFEAEKVVLQNHLESIAKMGSEGKSPTCFISYAWGDKPSEARVRQLAIELKQAGISTVLDTVDNQTGSIPVFVERVLKEDFVIVMASPLLKKKWENPKGRVVPLEQNLLGIRLVKRGDDHGIILALVDGEIDQSIPGFLSYLPCGLDFTRPVKYTQELFKLLGELYLKDKDKSLHVEKLKTSFEKLSVEIRTWDEPKLKEVLGGLETSTDMKGVEAILAERKRIDRGKLTFFLDSDESPSTLEKADNTTVKRYVSALALTDLFREDEVSKELIDLVNEDIEGAVLKPYMAGYLDEFFDSIVPKFQDESTALLDAALTQDLNKARVALKTPKMNINARRYRLTSSEDRDYYTCTALMIAASKGDSNVVRLLARNGADPRVKNGKYKTARDLALEGNHIAIAEYLGVYDEKFTKNLVLEDSSAARPRF